MALIGEKDREVLRKEFEHLTAPVKMMLFTQERECQYCRETRQIVEELAELSDKITAEVVDLVSDSQKSEAYKIDKIPAIAVLRDNGELKDYGIRYFGIPSGYEFSSVVEDILMVSSGESGLSAGTKRSVAEIEKPVHLQVFVTPTCPYCPKAVRLAHQLAMESDLITGDMVEAIEFPHLANKYDVMGVPRTVINEAYHLEGAAPESMVLEKLMEAVKA